MCFVMNTLNRDIISACSLTSELCIPKTGTSGKGNNPHDKSVNRISYVHHHWKSHCCPHNGGELISIGCEQS